MTNPTQSETLTISGHLLEAYKQIRQALDNHTEPPFGYEGYTARAKRDAALERATEHIDAIRELASS